MGEAFLKVVVDNLGSLSKEEMGLILGVEEEMKKLSSTLTTIQAVMEDAQVKQMDECKTHVSQVGLKKILYQRQHKIPIIGVGGLGRTTLAQLVFDERIWVCAVSDNFELKTLIKAMIESATDAQHLELDALERRLWELLRQKRYLVVLDDVWNDPQERNGLS